MIIVTPLHHYYREAHLMHVLQETRRLGPPRLRACLVDGVWYAQEGTHRLRAAKMLGVVPVMRPIPWRRTAAALVRARYAAILNGHVFERVDVETS